MTSFETVGDVHVAPNLEELTDAAADWILTRIRGVLAERERCSIALSGGATPGPVYRRLAQDALDNRYDGSRLDLFLADERCVPPDDEDSNAGLVREHWLDIDPRPTFVRPRGEAADHVQEAGVYAGKLPDALDLVVLGIGPDGHTASLFPGSDAVREAERRVVYVGDSPKPPPERWSLSPRALDDARELVTIVAGAAKSDALARALESPWNPLETPAQLARRGTWFVDAEAASALTRQSR
ncbi:MAG: 6-phosphogluconolactonase [Planctomycetota bacterium]